MTTVTAPVVPNLPRGHRVRRQSPDDTAAILAVAQANDIAVLGYPDFSTDDVEEILGSPHVDAEEDTWVVTDRDDVVVGWAFIDAPPGGERTQFDVYAEPRAHSGVRGALLDAVVARGAERATRQGLTTVTLDVGVVRGDDWAATLAERDFVARRTFNRMRIDLDGPRPFPTPPPGIGVALFDREAEEDWRDWHRIFQDSFARHWGHEPSSLDGFRRKVLAEPAPGFEEWFFGLADGERVGICQSTGTFRAENAGWIRNLGVLEVYRGRGIAGFLLEHAFATFAARDCAWAGLGVDTANETGALRLYEAVGMRAVFQVDAYQLEVPAS